MCGFFAYPTWEALSDIGVFASSTMIFSLSIQVEPCLFVSSMSHILIFTLPVTVLLVVVLLVTILPLSSLSDIGCKVIYSSPLVGWLLILITIHFVPKFIYMVIYVFILIRGSVPFSRIISSLVSIV